VISEPLVRARLDRIVPIDKRHAIRQAFIDEFQKKDFDGGLAAGVRAIEHALQGVEAVPRGAGVPPAPRAPAAHGGNIPRGAAAPNTLGTFLLIGLGIVAVLVVLRLLGGLFGRAQGGYPNQMGGMGMQRPGAGPGGPGYYGGPGYGGRGGGFFSGLLGGLGGALAGNWLYDQMAGRHGHSTSAGAGIPGEDTPAGLPDQGDDAIVGAEDDGGRGGSWDDGGGSDTGGGDWGGGDAGGGDWGGGGGDWGGGDAGGDWGGGGGDFGGGGDW
jgi:uncharacterized protein